jgi:hypothetical protein
VCCNTHAIRDEVHLAGARAAGQVAEFESLMAPSDAWRCRCSFGVAPCLRKATAEDVLCDWCRETDHQAWAWQQVELARSAAAREYLQLRAVTSYGAQAYSLGPVPYVRPR